MAKNLVKIQLSAISQFSTVFGPKLDIFNIFQTGSFSFDMQHDYI